MPLHLNIVARTNGVGLDRDVDLIHTVANAFNPQRVNNTPRKVTKENLRLILEELSKAEAS